jgi:phosphoenolpyruvate-protein phosphotransferase (PTS system enzyme I)
VADVDLIKGTAVSSGIAQGTAYLLSCAEGDAIPLRDIAPPQVDAELARFEAALARAERELLALKQTVAEKVGPDEAEIFAAHALLVRDPSFHDKVVSLVREKRINVEAAVSAVNDKFSHAFEDIPDPYLRERAADIRDVGRRILAELAELAAPTPQAGERGAPGPGIPDGAVVVADELLPSVTARLDLDRVSALVTERGGRFAHTAILARAQGTPAVAGASGATARIKTGDRIIVDGLSGVVFINPPANVQREYDRLQQEMRAYRQELHQLIDLPAVTRDGTRIALLANASKFSDTEAALMYKAEGIGLYRTEFGFSIRKLMPTEDEQFEFALRAAQRMHPRKLVFRLLDIGGDKELPYLPLPVRRNPSLARRGIRLLLEHPEILERQLRAFLRVSAEHDISILLPVVGGIEEVRQARAAIRQVQQQLAAEGIRFNPRVPVGAMIEVPSAALMASALAQEVDFFSLGTNDLVQYVLAADREDEGQTTYYQPLHPAVLRLIATLVEAATRGARPLSICGEMAGDPAYTALLLGLGLREFSVAPGKLLDVKRAIRDLDLADAQALAARALALGSVAEIEALVMGASPEPRPAPPG